MARTYTRVIDAINELPKARRVMAFSKRDVFAIQAQRSSVTGKPQFLIAMYSGAATGKGKGANDTFRGYF